MSKKFRKLRILWCGESSFLNTGYAIYAKELLTRLYNTNKYKIAEMGCYAAADAPQLAEVPWRFYPTLPLNDSENNIYNSNVANQFGEWRFNDICLDFRPDVVIDIRDWWMVEYQERSAFRRFFKWAIMPTVDSSPQQDQYINSYMNADAVFTYSEYGTRVLEENSNGHIKIIDTASPGANFEDFKPVPNKNQHRQSFGFMDNVNIVGTVMRNQRRKLYPNLIASFRKMLDENPEMKPNTYLYMHTAHPDLGWDIPYFLKKYNMSNHALFTYKCQSCGHFFPSFYQDVVSTCTRCGNQSAHMPNTNNGVEPKELGAILNWFDVYVQYSVCEGFGMPQVEAAACGVPIITVNYSAMESVGKALKAEMVEPKHFFWDSPTHSERAIPDDDELISKIKKIIKMPKSLRSKKGMDAYMGVKKNFTWEKASQAWERYLDSVEPITHEETWDSKEQIHIPEESAPEWIQTNKQFVDWGVQNVWGEPDKLNSYVALRLLKDLNCGRTLNTGQNLYYNENSYLETQQAFSPYNINNAMETLRSMCDYKNTWEERRVQLSQAENWDSIARPEFLSRVKPDQNTTNAAD